jgi:apolipoprotein N-acyltransferase
MYVDRTATLETAPDLILWGEDALYGGETLDAVGRQFVERYGPPPAPLLAGTATPGEPGHFFRWAALFDTDGTSLGGYAKRRPVPFGEYVPLRSLLGGISDVGRLVPSDMVPGRATSPLAVPVDGGTVDIGAAVSWEVSFSRLVRDVAQHADGMATLTTVSSYGTSAASDQLLAAAQLRAAEHQKPMAVAATTGRSAMIHATGDLVASTALLQQDDVTAAMPLRSGLTPFARAGDVPVGVAALVVLLVIVVRRSRDRADDEDAADPTDEVGQPATMDETADSASR